MSHALGAVRFPDGTVHFFDYDGTSSLCMPAFVECVADVHFRQMPDRHCRCDPSTHEAVTIYSNYGGGFWWSGMACRTCHVLIGPLAPYDEEDVRFPHEDEPRPRWVATIFGERWV